MKDSVKINGKRISLVTFNYQYITDEYLSWLKDERVNRYLLKPNQEITLDEATKYCEALMNSNDNHFFAILTNSEKRHIGNVRLGPVKEDGRRCQFSMMIGNTDYHGLGIGTEVVSLGAAYCFDTLNVHKVFLDVITENLPAIRIYEKNGFITEGLLKDHVFLNGRYHDLKLMGLINPDNDSRSI